MNLRAVATASAVLSALADGTVVALSYVTEDLPKGRGTPRRRIRVGGVAAYAALMAVDAVGWDLLTRPPGGALVRPPAPEVEAADRRYLVAATAGTVVLAGTGKAVGSLARRRGSTRPHLVFGIVAGVATTAATLPLWLAKARARVAAAEEGTGHDAQG